VAGPAGGAPILLRKPRSRGRPLHCRRCDGEPGSSIERGLFLLVERLGQDLDAGQSRDRVRLMASKSGPIHCATKAAARAGGSLLELPFQWGFARAPALCNQRRHAGNTAVNDGVRKGKEHLWRSGTACYPRRIAKEERCGPHVRRQSSWACRRHAHPRPPLATAWWPSESQVTFSPARLVLWTTEKPQGTPRSRLDVLPR
jgi:hypothetical protein